MGFRGGIAPVRGLVTDAGGFGWMTDALPEEVDSGIS